MELTPIASLTDNVVIKPMPLHRQRSGILIGYTFFVSPRLVCCNDFSYAHAYGNNVFSKASGAKCMLMYRILNATTAAT